MSHLAVADADEAFTRGQIERFGGARRRGSPPARATSPTAPPSCAIPRPGSTPSGAGSPSTASRRSRAIRPPTASPPAIRLESFVADVKLLAAGESAGYGRRFVAPEPTWIGLVPAGYADGVPRVLSGRADVLVRGRRRRVAATVEHGSAHVRDRAPSATSSPATP